MGVSGLAPYLRHAAKTVPLSSLSGQRVAVDGSVWMHRGCCGDCALDLATERPTEAYVHYCCRMARLLRQHGLYPIVVFDGRPLPAKEAERRKRAQLRQRAMEETQACAARVAALEAAVASHRNSADEQRASDERAELLRQLGEAQMQLSNAAQRTVCVTDDMVERTMAALWQIEGVQAMRAPYEADAQLAHLCRQKRVSLVLSADSDAVAYAIANIIIAIDTFKAEAQLVERGSLLSLRKGGFSLHGFTDDMLLHMCVLSGCDYLESPKRLGLLLANKLVRSLGQGQRVIKHLRIHRPNGVSVPHGYEAAFQQAVSTYLHQRVWSEEARALVPLSPLPIDVSGDIDHCIGAHMEPQQALHWVHGGVARALQLGPVAAPPAPVPTSRPDVHRRRAPALDARSRRNDAALSRGGSGQQTLLPLLFSSAARAAERCSLPPRLAVTPSASGQRCTGRRGSGLPRPSEFSADVLDLRGEAGACAGAVFDAALGVAKPVDVDAAPGAGRAGVAHVAGAGAEAASADPDADQGAHRDVDPDLDTDQNIRVDAEDAEDADADADADAGADATAEPDADLDGHLEARFDVFSNAKTGDEHDPHAPLDACARQTPAATPKNANGTETTVKAVHHDSQCSSGVHGSACHCSHSPHCSGSQSRQITKPANHKAGESLVSRGQAQRSENARAHTPHTAPQTRHQRPSSPEQALLPLPEMTSPPNRSRNGSPITAQHTPRPTAQHTPRPTVRPASAPQPVGSKESRRGLWLYMTPTSHQYQHHQHHQQQHQHHYHHHHQQQPSAAASSSNERAATPVPRSARDKTRRRRAVMATESRPATRQRLLSAMLLPC